MKTALNITKKIFYFIFLFCLSSNFAFAKESDSPTYTINFKNVPINEYVQFVSKICNQNFLFDETELNFNVSVVSEEDVISILLTFF